MAAKKRIKNKVKVLKNLSAAEDTIAEVIKQYKGEKTSEFATRMLNGFKSIKNMVRAAIRAADKQDYEDFMGKSYSAIKTLKQIGGQLKSADPSDKAVAKVFKKHVGMCLTTISNAIKATK